MSQLNVGFVGAGWMGAVQMKRICERDDVEIAALLEPNRGRGEQVLTELGLPKKLLVDDYGRIVNDPKIDAVWLVSPNSFHGPQSIEAMEAGKHVFCEKPAATTFGDFCRQIELARSNPKLKTYVNYILYFDTMEQRLRDMVGTGDFGQISQIQINYRHPINIKGDKVWKLRRDLMGDAIGMGINHGLSVMVNLMSPQAKPAAVYATNLEAKVRGFEAPPIWNILIKFDNGCSGFCFGNIDNSNGYDAYHSIFGTDGAFVFESLIDRPYKVKYWSTKKTNGDWIWPLNPGRCKAEGVEDLAWPDDTITPDSGDVVEHQTGECVGHFVECIKNNTDSPLSFINSQTIGEIGWAAQMSAGLNKEIALPLDWSEAKAFFDG